MDNVLEVLEEHLLLGRDEWEYVARLHEKRYPGQNRNVDSLRRNVSALYRKSAPTGDHTIPSDVLGANKIRQLMTEWADLGDIDDLDMEEDEFRTHDTTESFLSPGATVLTDLRLQGSVANDDVAPTGLRV